MFNRRNGTGSVSPGTQRFGSTPLYLLFGLLFSVVVFAFGYSVGSVAHGDGVAWGGILDSSAQAPSDVDMEQFWDVWSLVEGNYNKDVDHQEMLYGAMEGMLWSLGDPYSMYFTPESAEEFDQEIEGRFSGIGAEIGQRDAGITVISPIADTPAERAGLQPNDLILAVDGESTEGFSVEQAVQRIRGEAGTDVVLTLMRGAGEPFEVTITREEITVKSVEWEVRDDGIAVVTISVFNDDTVGLMEEAAADIVAAHANGVVLDLRNDPGGLLDAAIEVSSMWAGNRTVVIEKYQDGEDAYAGRAHPVFADMPTVVLVNGGSASASEIVSGALQDYALATIVGDVTYGKGSVQQMHRLPDGSAVKITVADWLTPNGRTITNVGITPDVLVEETAEDIHAGKTPQMDEAIRILSQS